MLRSPVAILGDHRVATVGVVMGVAVAMWFGAALVMSGVQLHQGATTWWEDFAPAVYLEPGISEEAVEAMAEEIAGWSSVAAVEVMDAEEMLALLQGHLGDEEVEVTAMMMPTRLVVEPQIWRPAEVEVLARLEALEVRSSVIAVDAPRPGALAWLEQARRVALGALVMALLGLLGALVGLGVLLRRLQELERRENHLLEVFGASPSSLSRPAVWRGTTLGIAAGVVGGGALLPWALFLENLMEELVGAGAIGALEAAVWAGVLVVVGAVLGGATGWICGRPSGRTDRDEKATLLEWDR